MGLSEVTDVLAALLEAAVVPAGGAVLDIAGTGVDAGSIDGQLAAALSSIGEKNAVKAAEQEAQRAQRQQQQQQPTQRAESPAAPARLFSFGGPKVGRGASMLWCVELRPLLLAGFIDTPSLDSYRGLVWRRMCTRPAVASFGLWPGSRGGIDMLNEVMAAEATYATPPCPVSCTCFAVVVQKAEEEEEEEVTKPQAAGRGLFIFGSQKVGRQYLTHKGNMAYVLHALPSQGVRPMAGKL